MVINMKYYDAKINWIPPAKGGRKKIPQTDNGYYPIIVVGDQQFDLQNALWSVCVYITKQINDFETFSKIRYFSEDAPFDLLSGETFKLYEGHKLVAHGIIL